MYIFSSIDSNIPRSVRHNFLSILNRSRQEGNAPVGRGRADLGLGPTSVSGRDIVSVPVKPPALRAAPPPPFGATGHPAAHSTGPRLYKRRIPRSPSPPVTLPVYTPLLEMGFTSQHIETAIAETGKYKNSCRGLCYYYSWDIAVTVPFMGYRSQLFLITVLIFVRLLFIPAIEFFPLLKIINAMS